MKPGVKWHRFAAVLWLALFIALPGAVIYPVRSLVNRTLIVAAAPLLWGGAVVLLWRRKILALCLLAVGPLIGVFLCLPGRGLSRDTLRAAFVRSLR